MNPLRLAGTICRLVHGLVLTGAWIVWAAPLEAQLAVTGLTTEGATWFDNDFPEPWGKAEGLFGSAFAVGDFNGDGVDDLATGAKGDSYDGVRGGAVVVRYGASAEGLVESRATLLRLGVMAPQNNDFFGDALAAGDFNGDSFDDLAVGIPWRGSNRGAVVVYYGAEAGLTIESEYIDESAAGGAEHACPAGSSFSYFGDALVAGNFDGDPYDDLAIGVPYGCEKGSSQLHGGAIYVAHGKPDGLLPFYGYRISQASDGIYDNVEAGDHFGSALAAGDFNADTYDDLAIGVPGENDSSGAVEIVMGSQWGLIFVNSYFWFPGALDEVPEADDELGAALAAADFDGDGCDDLAIGAPGEDLGPSNVNRATGSIDIAYGAPDPFWFDLSRTDHLAQSTIHGSELHDGPGDRFGSSFAVGDFDGDGRDDLAIGSPWDDWAGDDLGTVTVLMGAIPTLGASTRHYLIGIGWEGVPGDASQGDQLSGWAVAAGDFDGSGRSDLAIGVGRHDAGSQANAGGEVILYGETKVFADDFETGATYRWSTKFP